MNRADRVLVVDDDPQIVELLSCALEFAGFEVRTAADATCALAALTGDRPDALVLDLMLPGTSGLDLVQLLRARGDQLPVLMLTAMDAVEDRVRGLRLGADDYVTKPFSVVEVAVRLEALLRRARAGFRSEQEFDEILRCGDLALDEAGHRVTRSSRTVSLSPTEFRLLRYLLLNTGRVVSKGQILHHVWEYDFGGDSAVVERFVSNLRRKIDHDGPPLIHTVRGFGYTLREAMP